MSVSKNTVDWKIDKKYIKKHTGFDGSEDEWYAFCKETVIDNINDDIEKEKNSSIMSFFPGCNTNISPDITENETGPDKYGSQLTKYGIKNRFKATSKELEKSNSKAKVKCLFCKTVGLPDEHPASWVKFYRGVSGVYVQGRCKFHHKVETRMRERHHHNGSIGAFMEELVIWAYKKEGLNFPSKRQVVELIYTQTDKCYITGKIAVNPEKEHFWNQANGNPYVIFHEDGKYEYNILKASSIPNRSKRATSPEEYFSGTKIYDNALKILGIENIPKTYNDGRNIYSVKLVRKHYDYLLKNIKTKKSMRNRETKIRAMDKFIR